MPGSLNSWVFSGEKERTLFRSGLLLFVAAIAFSIGGMLYLRLFPSAMAELGPIYPTLVKIPTWTFMSLLPVLVLLLYGPTLGWTRIFLFLGWGCAIGAGSELLGTTGLLEIGGIALPFGGYQYTQWLGPKIGGHVPYFIPLSWFAMSTISLDMARGVTGRRWGAVLLGTLFMVLWDVALDPAMNRAFPFWSYDVNGFFFGMPFSNWVGWASVSALILVGYEFLGRGRQLNSEWAVWLYALNGLFPLAISLLRDLYLAALIGALAMTIPYVLLWRYNPAYLRRSRPTFGR